MAKPNRKGTEWTRHDWCSKGGAGLWYVMRGKGNEKTGYVLTSNGIVKHSIVKHSWAMLRKRIASNCYGKVAKGPEQQRKRIGSLGLEQYSCGIEWRRLAKTCKEQRGDKKWKQEESR